MDDIIDLSWSALCVTDDQVSGAAFQPFKPYNLIAFGYIEVILHWDSQ